MKSIDDLRELKLFYYDENENGHGEFKMLDMNMVADRIEDEIYDLYFPRPLFEDGEPVCFGDTVFFGDDGIDDMTLEVDSVLYDTFAITLMGFDQHGDGASASIMNEDRLKRALKRPREHDTQVKLDG